MGGTSCLPLRPLCFRENFCSSSNVQVTDQNIARTIHPRSSIDWPPYPSRNELEHHSERMDVTVFRTLRHDLSIMHVFPGVSLTRMIQSCIFTLSIQYNATLKTVWDWLAITITGSDWAKRVIHCILVRSPTGVALDRMPEPSLNCG